MAKQRWTRLASLLGVGLCLAVSCTGTRLAVQPGPGRLEALVGLEAVTYVLTHRPGPCVLIYHSPRCEFCRAVLRAMTSALPDLGPQAVIYTLDIDGNPDVRDAMGIGPVPVVVFLRDGVEVRRWRLYRPGFVVRAGLRRFFAP